MDLSIYRVVWISCMTFQSSKSEEKEATLMLSLMPGLRTSKTPLLLNSICPVSHNSSLDLSGKIYVPPPDGRSIIGKLQGAEVLRPSTLWL